MTPRMTTAMVKQIVKVRREIGRVIPKSGRSVLIKSPRNMVKATLSPTEYNNFSVLPSLLSLRILRISKPGTKVRKIKVTICLSPGISSPRDTTMARVIAEIVIRNLFIPKQGAPFSR